MKQKRKHDRAGLYVPSGAGVASDEGGALRPPHSAECAIGLTAVLEYLTAEILETAGDACYEKGRGNDKTVPNQHKATAYLSGSEGRRGTGKGNRT